MDYVHHVVGFACAMLLSHPHRLVHNAFFMITQQCSLTRTGFLPFPGQHRSKEPFFLHRFSFHGDTVGFQNLPTASVAMKSDEEKTDDL